MCVSRRCPRAIRESPLRGTGVCAVGAGITRPFVRPAPVFAGGASPSPTGTKETDCHTSDIGHWFAMTRGKMSVCAVGAGALDSPYVRHAPPTPSVSRLAGDSGCHLPRWGRQGGAPRASPPTGNGGLCRRGRRPRRPAVRPAPQTPSVSRLAGDGGCHRSTLRCPENAAGLR